MPSKSKVYFFFDNVAITLRNRQKLKTEIELLFAKEKRKLCRINYVFCSDNALLKINQKFLNHNNYTDIITFDLSENKKSIIGEVYISVDRVKNNAIRLKESTSDELQRVIFHGALHLCGYRDKSIADKKKMRAAEQFYIEKMAR